MTRGTHGNHARGSRHYRWNGGRMINADGYVKVRVGPDHPLADPNGYAYEHLVVWIAAGREAPAADELLHHVNGDRQDNRLANLAKMKRAEHNAHHLSERGRDERGRLQPAGATLDGREHREFPR